MVPPVGRPIVFISDFGLDDEFVGICHGVIARIAPEARVIDLTHGVPPQDIVRAALVLAEALPYVPEDAVLLAVVDPGVGTARRPIALGTRAPSGGDRLGGGGPALGHRDLPRTRRVRPGGRPRLGGHAARPAGAGRRPVVAGDR